MADGEHLYEIRATDAAGSTSSAFNAVRVTVDTAAPAVSGVTPQEGATEVALADNVEATFSEAMDPATLNATTFTLVEQGSGTTISVTVTYDGATKVATLNPDADLQATPPTPPRSTPVPGTLRAIRWLPTRHGRSLRPRRYPRKPGV